MCAKPIQGTRAVPPPLLPAQGLDTLLGQVQAKATPKRAYGSYVTGSALAAFAKVSSPPSRPGPLPSAHTQLHLRATQTALDNTPCSDPLTRAVCVARVHVSALPRVHPPSADAPG